VKVGKVLQEPPIVPDVLAKNRAVKWTGNDIDVRIYTYADATARSKA